MKSRKLSEDDRCSDTIAFEITKAVRMGHESNTATKFTIRAF
ncbi:hypothetical protein [Bacillus sp. X1(2014)]|nr:hypothetical protein [Bacillus sp. X1(2014)]